MERWIERVMTIGNYVPLPDFLPVNAGRLTKTGSLERKKRQKQLEISYLSRRVIVLQGVHTGSLGYIEEVFDVIHSATHDNRGTFFTVRISGEELQTSRHDLFFVLGEDDQQET